MMPAPRLPIARSSRSRRASTMRQLRPLLRRRWRLLMPALGRQSERRGASESGSAFVSDMTFGERRLMRVACVARHHQYSWEDHHPAMNTQDVKRSSTRPRPLSLRPQLARAPPQARLRLRGLRASRSSQLQRLSLLRLLLLLPQASTVTLAARRVRVGLEGHRRLTAGDAMMRRKTAATSPLPRAQRPRL